MRTLQLQGVNVADRIASRFACGIAASIMMWALAGCGSRAQSTPAAPPPLEVEVATVLEQNVAIAGEWIATLDGYVNAQIRPQVNESARL